jgi:DNA-binding MarR family transcriptional regulator
VALPAQPARQQATSIRRPPLTSQTAAGLEELVRTLSRIEHLVTRRLADLLADERVTVAQWRVLSLLADGAGHTMTELAQHTLLPAPTATRLINRMSLDKLVHRASDDQDRRRTLVRITANGRAQYVRLATRIERRQDAILTGADLASLRRLVDRLCGNSPRWHGHA